MNDMKSRIIIAKCEDYSKLSVDNAIKGIFDSLDTDTLFGKDAKVLLKPNMLSGKLPEKAVTTHPQIIGSFAGVMSERRVDIVMKYGDSPAADSPEKAARICGISDVLEPLGVTLGDFKNSTVKRFPEGKYVKEFLFVNAAYECDVIVNFPKFKTHALTLFTGALKNLFGMIPGFSKAKDHVRFPDETSFSRMLADMNMALPAKLHVMDAVVGMEGNGPANGTPREIGYVMASTDPVALDSFCVAMTGMKHKALPIILEAMNSGLGTMNLDEVEVVYVDPDNDDLCYKGVASDVVQRFVIHNFKSALMESSAIKFFSGGFGSFFKKYVNKRPEIIFDNCTKCRICVKACPVEPKAIEFNEKRQRIEYDYIKCIRCYCCQELCPHAAIESKKGPLGFLK